MAASIDIFSSTHLATLRGEALLGASSLRQQSSDGRSRALPLGVAAIDEVLPDRGLPYGSVVEICSPNGLARATQLALSACVSAQNQSRASSSDGDCSWCSWVDASRSLFAPGVVRAGVDLERLLIVQPDPQDIARVGVRLVSSRLFSVVVLDRCGIPGGELNEQRTRWDIAVRRLALAAERSDTIILLLSKLSQSQQRSLPTSLRIELSRPSLDRLSLRISKDRRGRISGPHTISLLKTL